MQSYMLSGRAVLEAERSIAVKLAQDADLDTKASKTYTHMQSQKECRAKDKIEQHIVFESPHVIALMLQITWRHYIMVQRCQPVLQKSIVQSGNAFCQDTYCSALVWWDC